MSGFGVKEPFKKAVICKNLTVMIKKHYIHFT